MVMLQTKAKYIAMGAIAAYATKKGVDKLNDSHRKANLPEFSHADSNRLPADFPKKGHLAKVLIAISQLASMLSGRAAGMAGAGSGLANHRVQHAEVSAGETPLSAGTVPDKMDNPSSENEAPPLPPRPSVSHSHSQQESSNHDSSRPQRASERLAKTMPQQMREMMDSGISGRKAFDQIVQQEMQSTGKSRARVLASTLAASFQATSPHIKAEAKSVGREFAENFLPHSLQAQILGAQIEISRTHVNEENKA